MPLGPRSVFWRQTGALIRKNWIIILKHPIISACRCLLFPMGYATILAVMPEIAFGSAADERRHQLVKVIGEILGIAYAIAFIMILEHLAGAFASERADLTTEYITAMGAMDSARLFSWHISFSLAHLPSWIVMALLWRFRLFQFTNVGLVLLVHVLYGLSLASWGLFIAVPFRKSPYLPGILAVALAIAFNVIPLAAIKEPTNAVAFVFSLIFPAASYVFSLRVIATSDSTGIATPFATNIEGAELALWSPLLASAVNIFLWFFLALWLEKYLFTVKNPGSSGALHAFKKKVNQGNNRLPPHLALSVTNLHKTFTSGTFTKKTTEVIGDLSLDVPKNGIFVLLGSNGAGKSTFLSILSNLVPRSSGDVLFADGSDRMPPGSLGVVPQKNVLFADLTCLENLKLWHAIKSPRNNGANDMEDLTQLLKDSDLGKKVHSLAGTMSGGQKRKLQLAIGLVGGSRLLLVDECTSGVDPLSRRAIWRTLNRFKDDRTILLTTHFLDEADLLADNIAVVGAPGKLIAQGTPVSLKRSYGEGYSLRVQLHNPSAASANALLGHVRAHAPEARILENDLTASNLTYRLKSEDNVVVERILRLVASYQGTSNSLSTGDQSSIESYDVVGPSLEDVFLRLMSEQDSEHNSYDGPAESAEPSTRPLQLTDGRQTSFLTQTYAVFYKRCLIAKTAWHTPVLMLVLIFAGTTLMLPVLKPPRATGPDGRRSDFLRQSCFNAGSGSTFPEDFDPGVGIPPGLGLLWQTAFAAIMSFTSSFPALYVTRERRTSSVQAMQFSNGLTRPVALWCGHLLFDMIVPVISSTLLVAIASTTGEFIGLGVFWVILILFWISTNLFAYMACLVIATPIVAFSAVAFVQLHVWSAHFNIHMTSVDADTTVAGQIMMHSVHFSLLVITPLTSLLRASQVTLNAFSLLCRGPRTHQYLDDSLGPSGQGHILAYGSPLIFLCILPWVYLFVLIRADNGTIPFLGRFGRNRGSSSNRWYLLGLGQKPTNAGEGNRSDGREWHQMTAVADVENEAQAGKKIQPGDDILSVQSISKTFKEKKGGENKVVDDLSLDIGRDTIFALLGPNGAGKTTTFNMIRGDLLPDKGDVLINGTSIVSNPMQARTKLGVCPQFSALDGVLTVREHLRHYGRLKGLNTKASSASGPTSELDVNVEMLLDAMKLREYADRQASKLSGGNQRKLSLAMAVIGNPSMILIDEFSTGVDAKMKRDLWVIVRSIAHGKAVIITTHSMEEAAALASEVGIFARRMLASGTPHSLTSRFAQYQVHFACRNSADMARVAEFMATHVPGSSPADDVATRFDVPLKSTSQSEDEADLTLPRLFKLLVVGFPESSGMEWTVEQPSLETVFLRVIRENDVQELEENRRREAGGRGR